MLQSVLKKMGVVNSKDRKIDEATSNSSLSNLRYVPVEKGKWNMFRKKEFAPIPAYPTTLKPLKGCPCGNDGPCKQKVTPRGVTIHYPQKKKKTFQALTSNLYRPSNKSNKKFISPTFQNGIAAIKKRIKRKPKKNLSRDMFMFMPFMMG